MKEEKIINEEIKEKKNKRGKSKLKTILIIFAVIMLIIFIYVRFIATSGFIVKEYGIESNKLPNNFNGFKIAHISDIHYASMGKEKLDKVVEEINIMKPDIVVFTGDLYDEFTNLTDEMKNNIIDSLSHINAPLGKYAVIGNHDYSNNCFRDLMEKSNFTYLHNSSELIYYNGNDPIEIVGYASVEKGEENYNINVSDNYKIALIHEGDAFDSIRDKNFDLVLAGHSHGGQVRLPIIGAIFLPPNGKKYYEEHYTVDNSEIYISFGLGETQYKIRAFNKPSFNFYRLYSTK